MSTRAQAIDGRKKKRPGVDEQKEIVTRAAIELFIQKGTKSVSLGQICDHAGVSRPTFYRCFKDKDELVTLLYQRSINSHVEALLQFAGQNDFKQPGWLEMGIDAMFDAIFEEAELARLVFIEQSDPSSPIAQTIDETFDKLAEQLLVAFSKNEQVPQSKSYFKAAMFSYQWLVQDAIKSGLSDADRKNAKEAAYALSQRVFVLK